jgi:hypothetical protein
MQKKIVSKNYPYPAEKYLKTRHLLLFRSVNIKVSQDVPVRSKIREIENQDRPFTLLCRSF